jgi:AbrB family looped-hinge helix DNA binding protein
MRTKVTSRGQVSIPAAIRRRLGIKSNRTIEWIVEGNTVRVVPIPEDPVAAFRGAGTGAALKRLVEDRRRERSRDA